MEPLRKCICSIALGETAVSREIIPLEQYEFSLETIGKLELMTKEIRVAGTFLNTVLRSRDVCPTWVQWIGGCTVEVVRHECQRICIKTFLSCHFTRRNGTCFHLKMSHMMSREDTFNVDDCSFFVAFLDNLN
jgi:hypothetical protein